jgi:hypothetical protein
MSAKPRHQISTREALYTLLDKLFIDENEQPDYEPPSGLPPPCQSCRAPIDDYRPNKRRKSEWGYQGNDDSSQSCSQSYGHPHFSPIEHTCCPPPPPPYPCQEDECGTEVVVDGILVAPECKPNIESIVRFKAKCRVTHWEPVTTKHGRKVVVTGLVDIHIEYVATKIDQPMHFVEFTVPFHTYFLCDRPLKDVCCSVEYIHYEMLDPRTISKVILLNVEGLFCQDGRMK